MTKEELIAKRSDRTLYSMSYEEAEKIQEQLIYIHKKEYVPKHSKSEYYDLIVEYKVGEISKRHPQETNWADTVFSCFSVVSQHVRGFTKEHCLDLVFEAVERQKAHIALWETLPTIEELVNSNVEIIPESEYQTKVSNHYTRTFKGVEVLEMREIGLSEWRVKEYNSLTPEWKKDLDRNFVMGLLDKKTRKWK